jgi:selenide, water dikinase
LRGEPLLDYQLQHRALALISTGDRSAVASYGPLAFGGAWVWRWKDRIDRTFMRRYRSAESI